jgi:hypothetical protein
MSRYRVVLYDDNSYGVQIRRLLWWEDLSHRRTEGDAREAMRLHIELDEERARKRKRKVRHILRDKL